MTAISRQEAPHFASLRLSRNKAAIAMDDSIRRLKRAGCSTEDIMQRLSVSPTRVYKVKEGRT